MTKFFRAPLFLILFFSFLIRLYNLNYNSPFLDEAIYLVLGRKVLAGHWQEAAPFGWVGGMPLFYPAISALFGTFGILGARFLNVLLGTFSVYLAYEFAKCLQLSDQQKTNERIGLIASAFMGILAIPIYLSRIAIYDMLSFSLFLSGLVFIQKALIIENPDLWQQENRFGLAAVAFFLSFLAKYTTLILFPLIIIWTIFKSLQSDKETFSKSIFYLTIPLAIAISGYLAWNFNDLAHFMRDQVRDPQNKTPEILSQFTMYSIFPLITGVVGGLILFFKNKRSTVLYLLLGATIPSVVHILTNNLKAAHQHTFLSIVFLLPLSAYLFSVLLKEKSLIGKFILPFALIVIFIYSQNQVVTLETSWTNTNKVMSALKSFTSRHEKVLSSEDDITILALPNLKEENIKGIYNFQYNNLSDQTAYGKALEESYFDFVLINEENSDRVSNVIKKSLTSHYDIIYNNSPFLVYKK